MSDETVSNVVDVQCGVVYKGDSYTVVLKIGNLPDEEFAWFLCEAMHRVAVQVLSEAAEDFEGSAKLITHPENGIRQ